MMDLPLASLAVHDQVAGELSGTWLPGLPALSCIGRATSVGASHSLFLTPFYQVVRHVSSLLSLSLAVHGQVAVVLSGTAGRLSGLLLQGPSSGHCVKRCKYRLGQGLAFAQKLRW